MAVRRRRTQLPPSPQRQEYHEGTQAIRDSGWMTGAGAAVGGTIGGIGGAIAGGFAGAAPTGGVGAVPGAIMGGLAGAGAGASLGASAGSAFAGMDIADYERGQADLDREYATKLMDMDLKMEQDARDYANRMSTLAGVTMSGLPQPRPAGYKWGNFRS